MREIIASIMVGSLIFGTLALMSVTNNALPVVTLAIVAAYIGGLWNGSR